MFTVYVHFQVKTGKPAQKVYNVDRILSGEAYSESTVLLWLFTGDAPLRFEDVSHMAVTIQY